MLLRSSSTKENYAKLRSFASTGIKFAVILFLIASAFAVSSSSAYGANQLASAVTTTSTVPNFSNTNTTVSSGGTEEPYITQQVALASDPGAVFQVTGAQIAQRLVGSAYKNYLYLFVNSEVTFPVNSTGQTVKDTISGYDTNNVYWNVQSPPTASGSTSFCATVGQDLDLGATSNTLSEWQWSDLNWGCGGKQISYTGSFDGGGPTACDTYSNNQLRESVYVIIVDAATSSVYMITGAILIQQNINGVASTTYIALVSGTAGRLVTSGDQEDCPVVTNPESTPSLRWYVRTPPVAGMISGATITGNFGITGTVGAGIGTASEDGNMMFEQFVDRSFQTGFIPNQGGSGDISILSSTNPVTNQTCPWPGTGCATTSSSSSSSTTKSSSTSNSSSTTTSQSSTTTSSSTTSSTTTPSSSTTTGTTTTTVTSTKTSTTTSTDTSTSTTKSSTSTSTTKTTSTSTSSTTTATSSSGDYLVTFAITPLLEYQNGTYYNVQTATFTRSGTPIDGASVTYLNNCGCGGGYYHGTTNSKGQTIFQDVYPGSGSYSEWASISYDGHTYLSPKINVQVP